MKSAQEGSLETLTPSEAIFPSKEAATTAVAAQTTKADPTKAARAGRPPPPWPQRSQRGARYSFPPSNPTTLWWLAPPPSPWRPGLIPQHLLRLQALGVRRAGGRAHQRQLRQPRHPHLRQRGGLYHGPPPGLHGGPHPAHQLRHLKLCPTATCQDHSHLPLGNRTQLQARHCLPGAH